MRAKMFILDTLCEVDSVRQLADLRFQDMCRRCGAMRYLPLVLEVEQRGLFLRSGQRNPEFLAFVDTKGGALQVAQDVGDFLVV